MLLLLPKECGGDVSSLSRNATQACTIWFYFVIAITDWTEPMKSLPCRVFLRLVMGLYMEF